MKFKCKTYFLFITLIVSAALIFTACGPAATEEAIELSENENDPKETLVFAVVPKITPPYYDDVLAGLEEATPGLEGVE